MKKFLLLPLLLGLPSPLFASDSTSGYKQMYSCTNKEKAVVYLMKKENANSKKWGVYSCSYNCSWADKAVSYDTAVDKYNEKSEKVSCNDGTTYINN